MAARAGATHVVVMERAHPETIKAMVQAAKDFGVKVMGDNLAAEDRVAAAKRLEDLGCDYVIHHIGYDERRGLAAMGKPYPSPLDQLREVVAAVEVPVQAVGGLSVEQAIRTPEFGARLVVLGAPLIEGGSSKAISKTSSVWFATEFTPISTKHSRVFSAASACGRMQTVAKIVGGRPKQAVLHRTGNNEVGQDRWPAIRPKRL